MGICGKTRYLSLIKFPLPAPNSPFNRYVIATCRQEGTKFFQDDTDPFFVNVTRKFFNLFHLFDIVFRLFDTMFRHFFNRFRYYVTLIRHFFILFSHLFIPFRYFFTTFRRRRPLNK